MIACFVRAEKLIKIIEPLIGVSNPIYVVIDAPRNSGDSSKIAEVRKILDKSGLNVKDILTFSSNQGTNSVALGIDWILQEGFIRSLD